MTSGPTTPTAGALRWLRGLVVGLSATGLAWAAHRVADGVSPSSTALAGLAVVATLVGVALSGRRWSLGSLLAVLLGAQAGFHLGFGLLASVGGGSMAGMPGMTGAGGMTSAVHLPGWPMLAAHAAAALVTALLLGRGEAWCWWLLALLGLGVAPLRLPSPTFLGGCRPAWPTFLGLPLPALLDDGRRRRGPPVAGILPA